MGDETRQRQREYESSTLRTALATLSRVPSLRRKYEAFLDKGVRLELSDLPSLTRDELGETVDTLIRSPSALNRASLHIMGGTSSAVHMGALPADLFVDEIAPHVQPFDSDDLVANLSTAFHLRASHELHKMLAARSDVPVLSLDAPTDDLISSYLDLFERHGVTTLASTLDTIRRVLRFCVASGHDLGFLRKLLWSGPVMDAGTQTLIADNFPHLRGWGLIGSTETWIVGHSTPECLPGVFHVLPYQRVEIVDGRILVTTIHSESVVPLLRYDTDAPGTLCTCTCDVQQPAVRTQGRIDAPNGPLSRLVSPADLVALAQQVEMVDAAQVILMDPHSDDERLLLKVRLREGIEAELYTTDWIHHWVVSNCLAMSEVTEEAPESFSVVAAHHLEGERPDGTAPSLVFKQSGAHLGSTQSNDHKSPYDRLIS